MSQSENRSKLIQLFSTLFILWVTLWLILLLLLPRESYSFLFFLMGILPVAGWFILKPRRIFWFISILFGFSNLDD